MRPELIAVLGFVLAVPALAQDTPAAALAGEYDGGQMEIGAGLRLERNGRFEYFLSYGALDEQATGRWHATGSGVVLDSDPVNEPRFELVASEPGPAEGFDISLETPDELPVGLFESAVLFGDNDGRGEDFEETAHHFVLQPGETVRAVMLAFPVYQLVSSRFDVPPGMHAMRFSFRPNDLGHVAFKSQLLRKDGNAYVLDRFGRTLRFRKRR
jgi:hypothetical protein